MSRYGALILLVLLLVVSAVLLQRQPVTPAWVALTDTAAQPAGQGLAFSETGHFYSQRIDIQITADTPDAEIYYTMDGSEPTTDSARYTEPIRLTATEDVKAVVLKAVSVQDGVTSRVRTHTYFMGKRVAERFDTLVFSLSTDPVHLYDYDTGILTEGRARDEFVAANPGHEIIPPDPANYNWRGAEGERPVYVEVFTPEGGRVVSQAAGIRVSGGWSRAAEYKSLRLIARRAYEPDAGKFAYDFFPEDVAADAYGTPITAYDSLILRNGANDREFGMLRNEVASLLAQDAGFDVVTPVRAASVFVNGEYYGFAWLQVTINEQYLQDLYGAPTDDFEVVGDGDQWFNTDNEQTLDDLRRMYAYAYTDLTDDELFAELEAQVDIDQMLAYFAFQIYLGNNDWPGGNLKRWRYTGPQTDGLPPELDGRWRYVLYDMDWVLGLYGDDYTLPTFQNVLRDDKKSPLLAAVLARPDMAERFTMMLCDLSSNRVTEETVAAYIDKLYGEAKNELFWAMRYRKFPQWVSFKHVLANHADMIAFAKGRGGYIRRSLRDYWDYGRDMVSITVKGGEAVIGTQRGETAQYFAGMDIPVRAVPAGFTVFDHWLIDGEPVYEPFITLSTTAGSTTLEMVTRYEPPLLAFEAAYAAASRNGCILINPSETAVTVRGLYVSDRLAQLDRWELPAIRVRPGEALVLAGRDSADRNDLYKIKMGFDAAPGEVLWLSDEAGTVLDFIVVDAE